jgi:MoxR-like ATPase
LGEPSAPPFVKEWVQWGVGPRGGQSLMTASRARAALDGRPEVSIGDIRAMAVPVLRHRIVLNYNAESQGETPATVIAKLLDSVPLTPKAAHDARLQVALKS